ncbi:superfamily II DNA/RNA helicase, SNF2 family, partial [Candidatus Scalindua japonica]
MLENEKNGLGLPPISSVVIILIVIGAVFFSLKHLQSSRPSDYGTSEYMRDTEDVYARLWQDPFGAIYKHEEDKSLHKGVHSRFVLEKIIKKNEITRPDEIHIIGVMAEGGHYFENVEQKRRRRYAIVSALNVSGYKPENAQKIGYFLTSDYKFTNDDNVKLPEKIPFELFKFRKGKPLIVLLWLDEEFFANNFLINIDALTEVLRIDQLFKNTNPENNIVEDGPKNETDSVKLTILGPSSSATLKSMADELGKSTTWGDLIAKVQSYTVKLATQQLYNNEKFVQRVKNDEEQVEVQDTMTKYIYAVFTTIKENLKLDKDGVVDKDDEFYTEVKKEIMNPKWTERDVNTEKVEWFSYVDLVKVCSQIREKWHHLKKLKLTIVSPIATVERNLLLEDKDIGELFTNNFPNGLFLRTIESDYELAECIYDELVLRGVKPGDDHIVIISEWDTDYGGWIQGSFNRVFNDRRRVFNDRRIIDCHRNYIKMIISEIEKRNIIKVREDVRPIIKIIKDESKKYEAKVMGAYEDNTNEDNTKAPYVSVKERIKKDKDNFDDFVVKKTKELYKSIFNNELKNAIKKVADKNDEFIDKTIKETIIQYSYIRGLDGTVSDDVTNYPAGQLQSKKENRNTEKNSSRVFVNPSIGNGQFDYLQRMGDIIQNKNRNLKKNGKGRIKAIGVLGSDAYDKLLVLQALRNKFPDVIFFTTDLDTRFSDPDEIRWTRNLIVASNFGLQLHPGLQNGIPPFRDNYQTSVFLSTLMILNVDFKNYYKNYVERCIRDEHKSIKIVLQLNSNLDLKKTIPPFKKEYKYSAYLRILHAINNRKDSSMNKFYQTEIHNLIKPKILEIGRHNPCELRQNLHPKEKAENTNLIFNKLETIFPGLDHSIYPDLPKFILDENKVYLLVYSIIFGVILFVTMVIKQKNHFLQWILISSYILIILLHYCFNKKPVDILEPFSLHEGISLWPAELLRFFSVICSGLILYFSYKKILKKNIDKLGDKYFDQNTELLTMDDICNWDALLVLLKSDNTQRLKEIRTKDVSKNIKLINTKKDKKKIKEIIKIIKEKIKKIEETRFTVVVEQLKSKLNKAGLLDKMLKTKNENELDNKMKEDFINIFNTIKDDLLFYKKCMDEIKDEFSAWYKEFTDKINEEVSAWYKIIRDKTIKEVSNSCNENEKDFTDKINEKFLNRYGKNKKEIDDMLLSFHKKCKSKIDNEAIKYFPQIKKELNDLNEIEILLTNYGELEIKETDMSDSQKQGIKRFNVKLLKKLFSQILIKSKIDNKAIKCFPVIRVFLIILTFITFSLFLWDFLDGISINHVDDDLRPNYNIIWIVTLIGLFIWCINDYLTKVTSLNNYEGKNNDSKQPVGLALSENRKRKYTVFFAILVNILLFLSTSCLLYWWNFIKRHETIREFFYVIWVIPIGLLSLLIIYYLDNVALSKKWYRFIDVREKYTVHDIWNFYSELGKYRNRFFRSTMFGLSFVIFSVFIIKMYGELPVPFRGDFSKFFDLGMTFLSFFLFVYLLFFVVDAVRHCVRFVNLIMDEEIAWSKETRIKFGIISDIHGTATDFWLKIRLIAERTEAVNKLINYPILVILF